MLVYCWASVADGGTKLNQHCFSVSCLLGYIVATAVTDLVNVTGDMDGLHSLATSVECKKRNILKYRNAVLRTVKNGQLIQNVDCNYFQTYNWYTACL